MPWLLSGLQLQADMGLLLAFAFIANLLGALLLLPALATVVPRFVTSVRAPYHHLRRSTQPGQSDD